MPIDRPEPLSEPLECVPDCLPEVVKSLYRQYNRHTEWYKNGVTILSFDFVMGRMLATDNRFIDFAFTYAGMGHVTIFFVDPLTKLVYERLDGGSNNYDRRLNALAHAERKDVSEMHQIDFLALLG